MSSSRYRQLVLPMAAFALCAGVGHAQPPAPAAASTFAFIPLVEQADARSAARDWAAAVPLWQQVVRANPTDGRYWSRLGTAYFNLHDYRAAIPPLERAVELGYGNPGNNAYNIACAYAQLGEKDRAFAWLERALAMGFLNLEPAMRDPDIAPLRSDPRFQRLIPLAVDVSHMSRTQGWRHDLEVLLWQMDRVGYAPYRLRPRSWFQQQFNELVANAAQRSDLRMALELQRIMREIGDGHSGIRHGATPEWAMSLPLQFRAFSDGVFITAAAPQHRDLVGAQVLAFDNKPAAEVLRALEDTVSRDNASGWTRVFAGNQLRYTALLHAAALIEHPDAATLRLRMPDGSERTSRVAADTAQPDIWNMKPAPPGWVTLSALLSGEAPLSEREQGRNYWFQHLPAERTVYWAFNTLRDQQPETLAAFAARLAAFIDENRVERLVIDLRHNNGGNEALMTPVLAELLRLRRINRPGHLVVLIGPQTFSAAQSAATLLDRYTEAVFVGEPTGSSPNFIGEDEEITLPYSRLTVSVSNLYHQNSLPQDRRTWIAPLIYAPTSFADYRGRRDPAMDAVLRTPIPQ